VTVAGNDAKSQHRRALADLQSTLVEHEEQLKDMERRTVTVTDIFFVWWLRIYLWSLLSFYCCIWNGIHCMLVLWQN